jgi:hypothetical protein
MEAFMDAGKSKLGAKHAQDDSNLSRRFLLQAGWAVPVITAVSLPAKVRHGSGFDHDSEHD